jgi:ADP-ribose pyrophosphatase YjhB (NUDIX family)
MVQHGITLAVLVLSGRRTKMSVRSTAKAIILHKGKILLNKCRDEHNGAYYCLPGGGQNDYETLSETLVRECLEETGYSVVPLRFAALCEEICDDPMIREQWPDYAHKMLHIFVCELLREETVPVTETDIAQTGSEWVEIGRLDGLRLLPAALGEQISVLITGDKPLFLGSSYIAYNHG